MAKHDNSGQPELSIEQQNAIDLLITGKSDRETAEAVGVARQTVTTWRTSNAAFIVELNRRRADLWNSQAERLRVLVAEAVDVLVDDMRQAEDLKRRQTAAIHILRAVGLYGAVPPPGEVLSLERVNLNLMMRDL
ncbi:MAG: hypothetical protein ACKOC5_19440 [Chloroflexota bacterium]